MIKSFQGLGIVFVLLAIASLGPLLYFHQQWLIEGRDFAEITAKLSSIRENVAEAHLWTEELITGDDTQEISEVTSRFADAHDAALEFETLLPEKGGGVVDSIVFGVSILESTSLLRATLNDLEKSANDRLGARSISAAGTESDISFDSIYKKVLESTRLIERTVRTQQEESSLRNFRNHQLTLVVWLVTLATTFALFLLLRHWQAKTEIEKKVLEARFQEAQKLESLGVLAGGIAHDFNNLLQAVSGNASLILHEEDLPDQIRDQVKEIEVGAMKASDLTSQMLAYAGKGRPSEKVVQFDKLVEEITSLVRLSTPKTIVVNYTLDANLGSIRCNETQIQQVVMNLVINATEASIQSHHAVEVKTYLKSVRADELDPSIGVAPELKDGEYVVFQVEDRGSGMSEESQSRCFEPFYSTKFTGRGLGLAAVLGIVRAHGGVLELESELGVGTCFRALLPTCEWVEQNETTAVELQSSSGEGRSALVIDDDPMVRKIVVRMLERSGYRVDSVDDGDLGVEAVKRANGRYHVVIIDMEMPGRNGLEVGRELHQEWSQLPLILSSGYGSELIQDSGPFQAFIQKPYSLQALTEVVSSVALPLDEFPGQSHEPRS
ncbi:MAG: response regulator [Planctomycetes bacterium]|jgi:signal transduction histidine kinase|nr:response regulator [Planctomycetota bacterium]MBT6451445.1 response regulator [Planctomycetota bacterium]MBT6540751.1 response regulator [Planctomycetota bacterium]MBT6784718.1 response regulator [Planctomycetota bacterium]MBT6967282.1 response regulator [Planctomycetota bacterium]